MDDCKISHVDTKVNDDLIKILKEEYESIFEDGTGKMTVNRGKVHCHLSGSVLEYAFLLFLEYLDQIIIDLCVHMADLTLENQLCKVA